MADDTTPKLNAKPGSTKQKLPQDFETALAQLEALVSQMEDGSLSLEQSLAAYQKGVDLAGICQKQLDTAEQQVKVLQGTLLKPLETSDPEGLAF